MPPARCPQLESLLPAGCVGVTSREEVDAPLFPAERRAVSRAVEGRRREFVTARACAREALAGLGVVEALAIPPGADGDPRWPAGIVGSIAHCEGLRAVAVARRAEVAALGIDAEPNVDLPPGVLEAISLPDERSRLHVCSEAEPAISWGRLLFSAKEAIYKAWFPFVRRRLGFEDATITFDRERRVFSVQLRRGCDRDLPVWSGRWVAHEGFLLTAVTVTDGPRFA
jgi:4'-phosphopantetheinyl transferase EntD